MYFGLLLRIAVWRSAFGVRRLAGHGHATSVHHTVTETHRLPLCQQACSTVHYRLQQTDRRFGTVLQFRVMLRDDVFCQLA
jgi:hypothetical protein